MPYAFYTNLLLNYTLKMVDVAREISNKTSPPLIFEKLLSSVETTLLTDLTFMIDATL